MRIKKQESLIKDITSENQALKEENDKFQIIIQQYMEKFLNLSKEANEKVNSDQIKDIACRAEMIIVNRILSLIFQLLHRKNNQ